MNKLTKISRIKAVHAACRAQGIDDDTRKAIQLQVTGKASLTEMSALDLSDLLNHLNKRKAKATDNEWSFVFRLSAERQPYGKKIFRLAERIGALQSPAVPVISKAYIEGITRQMRGTEQPLEFCNAEQLHKVIQALEVFVKRHGG